jgi:hypothetical protein
MLVVEKNKVKSRSEADAPHLEKLNIFERKKILTKW